MIDVEKEVKVELIKRELARRSMEYFAPYINKNYKAAWFHKYIMSRLDAFYNGEINRLMISLPPQTGKSELSTRLFAPYCIGRNPYLKIAVTTYGQQLSNGFNRDIQANMSSAEYGNLFPNIVLGQKSGSSVVIEKSLDKIDIAINEDGVVRRTDGFIKTTAVTSPLTGTAVDMLIIDDLYKDMEEAQSEAVRESRWNWFFSVANSRTHNNSKILFLMTRWHEEDLAGRLLASQSGEWELIRLPALKDESITDYDNRKLGESLWPERHSKERMEAIREQNETTFNALYQQDPRPPKNLLIFPNWHEMHPFKPEGVKIYGLDLGYENDPTALIEIHIDRKNVYVRELLYETGINNPKLMEIFKTVGIKKGDLIICDTNEPKTRVELRGKGWNVIKAIKGNKSIPAGIRKVNEFKVRFSRDSKNILRERNSYVYLMSGGRIIDVPIDRNNHAMDAIRTAIFTFFHKTRSSAGRIRIRN